jgi:PII-like signaling protein
VNADSLKLTVYFGESDRLGRHLLSDELLRLFEQAEVQASVLMRAVEGFGIKHQLRTDRLLTLSEDLPLVAVAVDDRARIEALLPDVSARVEGGLITLERARLLDRTLALAELPGELHEATKLTLYLGRDERVRGRPAYLAVVDHLRRTGLAGATFLLGVDGTMHRLRRRARFFSRNANVPVLVLSVGSGDLVHRALEGLRGLLTDPIATIERVQVCKRDGLRLTEPRALPEKDDAGLGVWQKLSVFAGEQAHHEGRPLHVQLIRRLREESASGATALRGVWGYSGDHPPHGDRLFAVHRRVPVVTTLVDTPERCRRWFDLIDELTDEAGLVTSEMVPAFQAVAPEFRHGGLKLARLRPP